MPSPALEKKQLQTHLTTSHFHVQGLKGKKMLPTKFSSAGYDRGKDFNICPVSLCASSAMRTRKGQMWVRRDTYGKDWCHCAALW